KAARIAGELVLTAKDEVLIVVKHAVFSLIAHRHGSHDRHFKNSRAAFVVEQYAAEVETPDNAFDHCIRAFTLTLHAQATPAMHELAHDCISETRFDFVTQRLALHLKRRHRDSLNSRRKLILSY